MFSVSVGARVWFRVRGLRSGGLGLGLGLGLVLMSGLGLGLGLVLGL